MTIQTGIPELDDLLGKGIAEGSSVMFINNPGTDSMALLIHVAYNSLRKEKNCLLYIDDYPPEEFIQKLSEFTKMDTNTFADLHYIDGFSVKTGIKSKEKYFVEDSNSVNSIVKTIDRAVKENKKNSVLLVKEFDKSVLSLGGNKSLDFLDRIVSNAINTHTTIFVSITNWDFSKEFIEELKKRFEYVIITENKDRKSSKANKFLVEKSPKQK